VEGMIGIRQDKMAKKKDRAFLICPRWNEIADAARIGARGVATPIRVHKEHLGAINEGRPVARSTLRKALVTARQASGAMFDIDSYIVDQRSAPAR
jgi:hypothetical protein